MPDTTVEEILEEVKTLPPEQQETLRKFMMTLLYMEERRDFLEKMLTLVPDDKQRLLEGLNANKHDTVEAAGRAQLARNVRGKYAHLPTGSEAFAARKAEEIRLEDRRSRP